MVSRRVSWARGLRSLARQCARPRKLWPMAVWCPSPARCQSQPNHLLTACRGERGALLHSINDNALETPQLS